MIGQFSQLWKMFIRPTRQEYTMQDMGFEIQVFKKFKAKRIDSVILNKKGLKLQCSLFEPISLDPEHNKYNNDKYPCVVYCHCNSGSRMEALRLVPDLIDRGVALFCFDFSGSGLSEGEYVTLGVNESHDLECVIEHLQDTGKISNIALWGRSMGAVTTFLYTSKNSQKKPLKGIVFDSGFSNLNFLAMDLAKQKTGMPNLIIEPALYLIKDQVKERVELNIQDIDLAKVLHHMYIPVYFVCSKEDTFVKCEHSEQLFHRYNGQKWLSYVSGNHNAPRSSETIAMLADWISNLLFERNQDHQEQSKGQSAFPRKNTLTVVAKIDLAQLQSPQQSQQQQQRKGSYQMSPGLPPDQQKSPRPQAYNSSQPSPSVRIDSRSVSPISQNPQKQQTQQQFGVTSAQVLQHQQHHQLQQQIAAHGVSADKLSYFGAQQQQKQQDQFNSKSQLPPALNLYSPKANNTKSPQLSPTVGGYSSVPGNQQQQPFKINLQAAPQSPQAGGNQPIMFAPYVSASQISNVVNNQTSAASPTLQQRQQDQSNKQQQQYYQTQQPDPLKQAEDQRLSLKQQSIIDQLMSEKISQSQQESMSSQSRLPTEENSSIGGNAGGNCGVRGSSAQHGYSFLSNPNEELISYDRNSTPSRKSPLGSAGMPGSSNPQIKLEESSQDSNNSSKPQKRSSDSQQFAVLYEQVDEKNIKPNSNNANFNSFTLLIGDTPYQQQQMTDQQPQIPKPQNKIQVAPIIVSRPNQPTDEGSGTPQFRGEKRPNIFLQAEDSPCNSPGIIAQEQPLEALPQPLQYTNTRNPSHFSLAKQTSPRNAQNNQDMPQSDHPNRFSFPGSSNNPNGITNTTTATTTTQGQQQQQQQQPPSQQKPEQSLPLLPLTQQQQQASLHRSVRSSTYNTQTTPTNSSTNIPSSNNNNTNSAGIGSNTLSRQRNAEISKSEIPQNIMDQTSPKLAYQSSAPLNKQLQPSSSSTSTFSQAAQQQDFLSIKSTFLSSYSQAIPNAPATESIPNNTVSGNIRVRPQNNSLDITNNLGFIQDLSKNISSVGQLGYLVSGGSNFQPQQKTSKFNTFSTSKAQETSAALAQIPLISQDHQKNPIFEHYMKTPSIFTAQGKTSGFGANQKQTILNTSNPQLVQPLQSVGQQLLQQQQQQDKKNQVKTVGISIISPRQSQQNQQLPSELHKPQSEQQIFQPFFPVDSSSRVSTETSSYSSVTDKTFKFQNNGKDEVTIRKDSTNSKDIAQNNSQNNTPQAGTSTSNSAQSKNNQESNTASVLNSNNYNTNPSSSSSTSASNNISKNANSSCFSLGPSKYFTTYDGQSYPQQGYQKPSQQVQQPSQQSFSELSQQFAFATQVSPITKQTSSVANTPKVTPSQQQQRQSLQPSGSSQPSRSYFEATLPSSFQSASNQQMKSYNTNNSYNSMSSNSNKNNNSNFNYLTSNPQSITPNNFQSNSNTSYSGSNSTSNSLQNNSQPAMPMTSSKGLTTNLDQLKQQLQQSQQKYNLSEGFQSGTSGSTVNNNNNSSSSSFFGLK